MIKFEAWPPRQQGGQHVGCGPSGIRGVHYLTDGDRVYPTGIEAVCDTSRGQHKNKQVVVEMIEWACAATRTPLDIDIPAQQAKEGE